MMQELVCHRHKNCLEEVRRVFHETKDQLDTMLMIDFLQRLGIDYHFSEEIKTKIDSLCNNHFSIIDDGLHNVVKVTLLFRLLRQARHPISSNIFSIFLDGKGNFSSSLTKEIDGMVNLYEASYLNTGEEMLYRANTFASEHLKSSMACLESNDARFIQQTLDYPYHMSLQRYKARQYLDHHHQDKGIRRIIQELARMDFILIQSLHKQELKEMTCWWRNTGLSQELRFARDQSLKWYVWSMTSLPNPKFSQHRLALTKVIAFVYLIDDIFDLKGSLDELRLFTDAINKWEVSAIDLLPCYMRKCYDALYKTTNEIAEMIFEEHGWNPINILKKSWIELSDAFMREAMWFAKGHVPPADDYLRNGVISCGVPLVLTHLNFLLGGGAMDSAESYTNLISSPATILRLWDDLGSAKDEKQEGFDGSYLECFMKENPQCSVESAREHVMQMICKAWEELNKESFSSSSFSQDFVTACLNTARMVKLMYSYNEEHKLPMLEECVTLLLFKAPNLKA
ncbi:unnamed protein product [Musa hybrid cultivar]